MMKKKLTGLSYRGKELTPGYALVPDGSGSFSQIRRQTIQSSVNIRSKVYGTDPSTELNILCNKR